MSENNTNFVLYCKTCQKKMEDHDDEDISRCLKVAEMSFWKKE